MTKHGALSIVANIKPGKKQQLNDLCKEMEAMGVENNSIVPFKKLTSIHFARFVIFDESEDAYGNIVEAKLSFTTNYDEPYDQHLDELISFAGPGLWQIFSNCEDFPVNESYNKQSLINYLQSKTVENAVFYVGIGYRSVLQIKQEDELREEIEDFLDRQSSSLKNIGAVITRQKVIDYVNSHPALQWAKTPVEKPSAAWKAGYYGKATFAALLLLLLAVFWVPFVFIWLILILLTEMKEKDVKYEFDKKHIREIVERETGLVQCQFSAMGNIKPGWIRQQTMMFLLHMTNFLAPYLYTKGKLSGIPTVHFARWIIVNKGRQMIFLSNFDGNSESYLRDFINIAGKQLSLMFCHTVGYPKTRLMIIGGADDANGFMKWARKFHTISNVWYSANKNVSVKNIFNNSKIRDGLYGNMDEKQAAHWLSLL